MEEGYGCRVVFEDCQDNFLHVGLVGHGFESLHHKTSQSSPSSRWLQLYFVTVEQKCTTSRGISTQFQNLIITRSDGK